MINVKIFVKIDGKCFCTWPKFYLAADILENRVYLYGFSNIMKNAYTNNVTFTS